MDSEEVKIRPLSSQLNGPKQLPDWSARLGSVMWVILPYFQYFSVSLRPKVQMVYWLFHKP